MNNQNYNEEVKQTIGVVQQNVEAVRPIEVNKPNLLTGVIGALIGALVGILAWILIYKLGVIAAIGGFVIAYGVLFGFEKLGKGLDKKSLFICLGIIILSVWLANKICWALEASIALKEVYSFSQCFTYLSELLEASSLTGSYYKELFIGYILTALGSYKMIINIFKNV